MFESIERASQQYSVHPQRVFLAGFDQGGTMAMRIAMGHPSRLAGVISLCGEFPKGRTPFGNLVAARRLGILLASGRTSLDYPAAQVCQDLRLLHTAGLSITLRQYPCGQEIMPQMLADVDRWIIEQIAPRATRPWNRTPSGLASASSGWRSRLDCSVEQTFFSARRRHERACRHSFVAPHC